METSTQYMSYDLLLHLPGDATFSKSVILTSTNLSPLWASLGEAIEITSLESCSSQLPRYTSSKNGQHNLTQPCHHHEHNGLAEGAGGKTLKIEHIGNKIESALLKMPYWMGHSYQSFRINSKVKRIYLPPPPTTRRWPPPSMRIRRQSSSIHQWIPKLSSPTIASTSIGTKRLRR